ncbi:MAG: pro-sigmaK processing inhibitor BofA family protein [Bacilli bacterium]
MKIVINVVKKIVIAICMLYTINLIIFKTGNIIPINLISISFVSVLGLPAIVGLFVLKKIIG